MNRQLLSPLFFAAPLLVIAAGCIVHDCPEPVYTEAPPPPPPGQASPADGAGAPVCGSRGTSPCAANEFCDFADGTQCGAADQGGVCRLRPEVCTEEYAPVCGCDGRTYANSCDSHRAGVDVSYEGECGEGGAPEDSVDGGGPGARAGCMPGGCSGQLCVEQGEEAISTCEWRPEYACYRSAACERQADGQCGWTPTAELEQCLASPPAP